MADAYLEHVNITVHDPDMTAQMLVELFGWKIRWKGAAINGGTSIHVGGDSSYIAVYSGGGREAMQQVSYNTPGALNHIGVVVDDIDAAEARVKAAGFTPCNHGDYEPGKRFYFDDMNGVEIEVVCYDT